ncbi:MAG TPA: LysR family transcriptional regulator [Polyangiales bacterium]
MNMIHDERSALERLAGLDLNLVVAFDALARERSATRAAARLGVTQSAVSHALRRLRELLGDPLLVRSGNAMLLTPRAEELVVPLRSGLLQLSRALSGPAAFDAATAQRAFTLASIDLFDLLAVPTLLGDVRREAPGVDLNVVSALDRRLPERLETGEVDLAVAVQIHVPGQESTISSTPGLVQKALFRDHMVCFVRAGHPVLERSAARAHKVPDALTLERYLALSHALISLGGEGPGVVDVALRERGLRRRIALRIPHFYSALTMVAASDLVLTAPSALAGVSGAAEVVALSAPLPLPEHSVGLVWHERFNNEPGHRWLRELIAEAARAARARTLKATSGREAQLPAGKSKSKPRPSKMR